MQANASGKHTGKRTTGHGNVGCCSIKTFTRTRAESVEFKSKPDHWKRVLCVCVCALRASYTYRFSYTREQPCTIQFPTRKDDLFVHRKFCFLREAVYATHFHCAGRCCKPWNVCFGDRRDIMKPSGSSHDGPS